MSDVTLGKILNGTNHRDAIHIAIAPVFAADKLSPGEEVGFIDDAKTRVGKSAKPLGIVDPFLTEDVRRDQQFYLWLFPQTVTGMRHEWQHPEFNKEVKANSASEQWLRQFADQVDCDYDTMMAGAEDYHTSRERGRYGEYLCDGGRWEGTSIPDEFWEHYQNVTGKTVHEDNRGTFFSCSC